jgi:competence protein ComEC
MMRRFACAFSILAFVSLFLRAPSLFGAPKSLEIYFIDVEGGAATLVVSPSGQSILIDTGWSDFNGRDADRIVSAAHAAGLDHLDYLVITHYHRDHVGGVAQLASRMKILTFMDHGPNMENSDATREDYATYEKIAATGKRIELRPGGTIPVNEVNVQVVAAGGDHITSALPGADEPNPYCASEPAPPEDSSENARSVGLMITYGKFRFLDLGDLSKKKELDLVCPKNLLGTVDLYQVTHHGVDSSNAKAIVDAVHARVAISDNGAHKGGAPATWQIVHDSPGLLDIWQLHYAEDAGKDHNSAPEFIANLSENCEGKYIETLAQSDGTFSVRNSRNNFEKTYRK